MLLFAYCNWFSISVTLTSIDKTSFDADKFPYEIVFELEMPLEISSLKSKELLKKIDTLLKLLVKIYDDVFFEIKNSLLGNQRESLFEKLFLNTKVEV